jgi:hypothetical protein
MTDFAALDDAITAATMAALSDVTVIPDGGGDPFPAILDIARTELFEAARTCDWTIRYAVGPELAARATVRIEGSRHINPAAACQLAADPVPLAGGREYRADIIVRA